MAASDAATRLGWAEVLTAEAHAIFGTGATAQTIRTRGVALCLSGGGIRSAAFCLGVVQMLARARLLHRCDYLSTVSGGGYTGGWLAAWIARKAGGASVVQDELGAARPPPELNALREWTSFLIPRPGLTSPETWGDGILALRNILVNWLVFGPALLALALLPVAYMELLDQARGAMAAPDHAGVRALLGLLGLAALGALGWATFNACRYLPSHAEAMATGQPDAPRGLAVAAVRLRIVTPILVWVALAPLGLAADHPLYVVPALSLLGMLGGYAAAGATMTGPHRHFFVHNAAFWVLGCGLAAGLLTLGAWTGEGQPVAVVAVLGPLWVALAHIAQTAVFVALREEALRPDMDREWLARVNAQKLIPVLVWTLLAAACLLLPPLLLDHWQTEVWPRLVVLVGLASGPVAAGLGKAASSVFAPMAATSAPILSLERVIALATVVFAAALFMLLGHVAAMIPPLLPMLAPWLVALGAAAALLGLSLLLGWRINVNRFSLNGVYRNRLARAFLGSARPPGTRVRADPLTDFDEDDNPRMTTLWRDRAPAEGCLFPVLNVALNLTGRTRAAWAERKCAAFTITPAACGFTLPGGRGHYVATASYAGPETEPELGGQGASGISLATAMAISGAAVSPNMGYHSSAVTAFLMTLFNVRLGAWLPNPAWPGPIDFLQAKPPNALVALMREMVGMADGSGRAVYLSDGGHFDNTGVYEMLRRRCRLIIAVDGGEDPGYSYGDTAAVVRKAAIDLNVAIQLEPALRTGETGLVRPCVRATIRYPEDPPDQDPDQCAQLIWIKAHRPRSWPVDVQSYAAANPDFPQQSTIQQFFTESQFESYRHLGEVIAGASLNRLTRAFKPIPDRNPP